MAEEQDTGLELDAAQVNALLQARATGRVGAILSDAGVPAKTGGRVLAMLRAFGAEGFLIERPVVDEETRQIVYFELAPRAKLDFLDLAAIKILRAFAEERRQIETALDALRNANESVTGELRELEALLTKLHSELNSIATGVAVIAVRAKKECKSYEGPETGPDASRISIADQATGLSDRLLEIIRPVEFEKG